MWTVGVDVDAGIGEDEAKRATSIGRAVMMRKTKRKTKREQSRLTKRTYLTSGWDRTYGRGWIAGGCADTGEERERKEGRKGG